MAAAALLNLTFLSALSFSSQELFPFVESFSNNHAALQINNWRRRRNNSDDDDINNDNEINNCEEEEEK